MMQHILIVKIQLRKLFQIRFLKIVYEIARNRNYDGNQRALASMVYRFFDKKAGSGINVNEQLAEELQKPVIKKFKRKIYATLKDNIQAAYLAEMGSLSSKNKELNIYV